MATLMKQAEQIMGNQDYKPDIDPKLATELFEAVANPSGLLYDIAHARRPNMGDTYASEDFLRRYEEDADRHTENFIAAAKLFRGKNKAS